MLKKAYFYDKENKKHKVIVDYYANILTMSVIEDSNEIALLEVIIETNRLYINTIQCKKDYTNKGIATSLLNIFEYLYKDYTGIIYGMYAPFNKSLSRKENDIICTHFYEKNGYEIVSENKYLENPELYPGLEPINFIETVERNNKSLIYKRHVDKVNDHFIEENGIIYEKRKEKVKKIEK